MAHVVDDNAIKFIEENGGFRNAIYGGLVIGKKHSEGGIMMVTAADENKFVFVGEMEHGEYIMCPEATKMFIDRLNEINSDNEPNELSIDGIRKVRNLIFTGNTFATLGIISGDQYIINANSTAKYLEELDRLNSEALQLEKKI